MTGLPDPAAIPLLTVEQARHAVGDVLGRSAFYAGLSSGAIPGLRRVGRRVFVSVAELREWVGLDAPTANAAATNGVSPRSAQSRTGVEFVLDAGP